MDIRGKNKMENSHFKTIKFLEDEFIAYFQELDTNEKEIALKKLKTFYLTYRCPTARYPQSVLKNILD